MKKLTIALLIIIQLFVFSGCNQTLKEYTIEEAFVLLNEGIEEYLQATSLEMNYRGDYASLSFNNEEALNIKLKKMDSDNFLARIYISSTENGATSSTLLHYESGYVYNKFTSSTELTKTKVEADGTAFQEVYTAFIKKTIDYDKTREHHIQSDLDYLLVEFEYSSTEVNDTFLIKPYLDTVNFASVSAKLNHKGKLISLDVSYQGTIQNETGTQSYHVDFVKIGGYVVLDQLSYLEKDDYEEVESEE